MERVKIFIKSKINYLGRGIDKYMTHILFVLNLVIPAWYFGIMGMGVHAVLCIIAAIVLGVATLYDE